jgi:dTDP-4-amino-4,6-dideoxygalactose transaminase
MKVPYLSLNQQWSDIREEALLLIDEVLSTGKYIEHEIVSLLEKELATKLGVKHVVLVNSGTDALMLGLYALGIKKFDEVITVPNSFIATVAAIQHVGAIPVMVDVGPDHLMDVSKIESAITSKTRAIMPVHLEGKVCNMAKISEIAKRYGLFVVEDVAQAFGSKFSGKMAGSFSDAACFSLHPLKNLNACGDGGFVATNSLRVAERINSLRNHGLRERNNSLEFGFVSRFDSIQAAILFIRLKKFDQVVSQRRENAAIYDLAFKNSDIIAPIVSNEVFHTYHTYNVEIDNRDKVREKLLELGIDSRIHYPKLITEQAAYLDKFGSCLEQIPNAINQKLRILSIPIHAHLKADEVAYVANQMLLQYS